MTLRWIWGAVLAAALQAQEPVRVPFSDAARPRFVRANLLAGNITVTGYDGKDVLVETSTGRAGSTRPPEPPRADGLRRLDQGPGGLTVEEQDNVVRISRSPLSPGSDLHIKVPFQCSLQLKSINSGRIVVERVEGEIDVNSLNGAVLLNNVSGSVLAHALNGKVTVTLDRVQGAKPMSFSTLNGDIDVTLPADLKARVKLKTNNGEVLTDFEVKVDPTAGTKVEDSRSSNGRYRVQVDRTIFGTINGGGPEMQFTTLNGKIYIRKKK